ncbi:hypothetical protein [Flavihumibacter fluvii]|uniref:hypothetical protein n=1 Tax=Flavihumibacter fluvii TaxID=2838157 RepID=UPI001BDEB8C9|nr:hypothetical protein [Flavihumibacter fluvii]ULQ52053.1 hypothetical protein KJS93_18330 [Flavihumibacter fluvii]
MKDNFTTEELVQYLDGELGSETARDLQQKLGTDIALRNEFNRLKLSREAIRLQGVTEKVGNIHHQMMRELQQGKSQQQTPVVRLFRPFMRIAAAVLVFVGIAAVYQYSQLSTERLYEGNYIAYSAGERRGQLQESPVEQAFKTGQPEKVILAFKSIQQPTVQDYFYAGNAYLEQGQAAVAIQQFLKVQELNAANPPASFEDDTDYYLAMAYLKNGQAKEASNLLEKIHQTKGHLYHDKVSNWFLWKLKMVGNI